ncbi:MAG TPA: hypothetical protein VFK05_09170 [Polyangiaceae bacterium]|nr:hypothetical protein [Polyangiaceae bacterium]
MNTTLNRALCLLALPLTFAVTGCPKESELTTAEAQESLQQAAASSQAENLAAASVDISTNFTIGGALEKAAGELKTFIDSQLPCADVTLEGATLTVEYGVNPGNCVYRGHTFSGSSSITVSKNAMNEVVVDHVWSALSNGQVKLDGTAHVTWNFSDQTRHVVHDVTWTQLASGRTGKGTGDRTQRPLSGGITEGIQIDGSRSWTGARGTWDLAIDGVQVRWSDPVPQAGSYSLSTPFDKSVSMNFTRVDADTIKVTVAGSKKEFSFTVSKAGSISSN